MPNSSKWETSLSLEWSTELPYEGIYRMSPVFRVRGIENYFKVYRDIHYFYVALNPVDEKSRSSFTATVYVELKTRNSTDLVYGPKNCFFYDKIFLQIEQSKIISKVKNDLFSCSKMRFFFAFASFVELYLPGLENKRGEKSTQADLALVQPDLEYLSMDFGSLLDNEVNPDVRIQCEDGVIPAHRTILSARSRVFAAMFQTNMKEKRSGLVKVQHTDLQTMRLFLKFLYSGKIPDFPLEMASSFYSLGDKYEVPALKKMCGDFMARNVSEENYTEFLYLADAHADETFKQAVIAFIINNPNLMRNHYWLKFSSEHAKLALEVAQKYIDDLCVIE